MSLTENEAKFWDDFQDAALPGRRDPSNRHFNAAHARKWRRCAAVLNNMEDIDMVNDRGEHKNLMRIREMTEACHHLASSLRKKGLEIHLNDSLMVERAAMMQRAGRMCVDTLISDVERKHKCDLFAVLSKESKRLEKSDVNRLKWIVGSNSSPQKSNARPHPVVPDLRL